MALAGIATIGIMKNLTFLQDIEDWIQHFAWLEMLTSLGILILVAWLSNWLAKHVLIRGLKQLAKKLPIDRHGILGRRKVISRLANAVPAIIILNGISKVPHLSSGLIHLVELLAQSFVILTIALTVSAAINVANDLYEFRPDSRSKPIKGYLQLLKIILFIVCGLLVIGTMLQRDVFTMLAGFGAMAAVLMLIFQNTILSLVASVQVASYDMVRIGDWIEMPALNADGDVIDISLHTVKVQNFDKTITTIPTNRLVTDTFRNWRGVTEAGGRRIKRALLIDQTSVNFLDEPAFDKLKASVLLDKYLDEKHHEIGIWNQRLADKANVSLNRRRLTNLGTFRTYVDHYLRQHSGIHQGMTILVRQLDPTSQGIPLEIYCFTLKTEWAFYENVQSDIFDHLLAILPEFGLRVFQAPSGADIIAAKLPLPDLN